MNAALVERPGSLVVRDIPIPRVGDYDVLCQMLYGATCTGTDGHIIAGRFPYPVQYPTVLGHESIGRVVETGAKVKYFKKGDMVTRVGVLPCPEEGFDVNWGGFAEFGVARDHWSMCKDGRAVHEWNGFRVNQIIPEGINPDEATMIITWRETLSYIRRMGLRAGHRLLVIGSGGNGLAFAAHGINLGAEEVVMIGNGDREQVAHALGITDYYDYKDVDIKKRI